MKLNIRGSFSLSKWWRRLINEHEYLAINDEHRVHSNSDIIFQTFLGNDRVAVSCRDLNIQLNFPINTPLNFSVDDIREEFKRFLSFKDYAPFTSTKYRNRRLIIYHNNPLLIALMEYLITLKNYKSYHIFSCSNESYNSFKYLEKKYRVRLNDVETNFSSALRLLQNDYEEVYNDDDVYNDDVIIFFSKNNSVQEICCALNWYKQCYLSLPYNSFILCALKYLYRYYCNIEVVSNSNDYVIVKVTRDTYRYTTTNMFIEKIKKYWKEKLRKKLFPMYY